MSSTMKHWRLEVSINQWEMISITANQSPWNLQSTKQMTGPIHETQELSPSTNHQMTTDFHQWEPISTHEKQSKHTHNINSKTKSKCINDLYKVIDDLHKV